MTRLQRVQVGKRVLYAAAMILMKDRDATLEALSKGAMRDPQHLALAEELLSNVEKEALRRKKINGPVQ